MQIQARWENQLLALAGKVPNPSARPFLPDWGGDSILQKAYQHADEMTRQHSKSFYMASSLLPADKRCAVRALYAFCRTVDDIVDEDTGGRREANLGYWREVVETAAHHDRDLVAAAWTDTMTRYHVPPHYALQLIDGVTRDLTQSCYRSFEELATYCYAVASTVGLMSMYIVGFGSNNAVPYAIKLGVALQMTNILRDVGEDYRNGRLYLPLDELHQFGVSEADISAGRITDAWRVFMRFQIGRTCKLYAEAWPGVGMLEREGQLAIGAAAAFYQGILRAIEKNDYDVFNNRASLSALEKMAGVPALWWRVRTIS